MKTTLIWGATNEHLIQDISLSNAKIKRVNDLGLEKINLAKANPWLLSSSYIWKYLLGSFYNKDIKAGIFTVSLSNLLVFLHCSEFTSPDDSDVQGVSLYRCAVIISANCKASSSTEISVNSFLRLLELSLRVWVSSLSKSCSPYARLKKPKNNHDKFVTRFSWK